MSKFNWDPNGPKMQVSGHRGARWTKPENTMTSFKYALEIGCDSIETDIRFTKDKQLVLMHDDTVDRTTEGHGPVREHTLAEFKALNAAYGFEDFGPEAPPTFEELLQLCCAQEKKIFINCEFKEYPVDGRDEFAYECADAIIEMIRKYDYEEHFVINSFSAKLLEYIVDKYPGEKPGTCMYPVHGFYPYETMSDASRCPGEYCDCLCVYTHHYLPDGTRRVENYHVPTREVCEKLKAEGKEIWVGPMVSSYDELKAAVERGINVVCSDFPEDSLRILRELGYHD